MRYLSQPNSIRCIEALFEIPAYRHYSGHPPSLFRASHGQIAAQAAFALALTFPVYWLLAHSPLDDWFLSGAGWRAFESWFRVERALGVQGDGRIVIGTMLAASFLLALLLVCAATRLRTPRGGRAR